MTVLDMTQDILSSMGSDNVNSINDTYEAKQVSFILKNTYFDIITRRKWDHLGTLGQLTASGTTDRPTHMDLPARTQRVEFIKYNKKTSASAKDSYEDVAYMTPQAFIDILESRDSTATNIQEVMDTTGVPLLIRNDSQPTAWTSFDETTVVFDSFYSDLDSTLQTSKTKLFMFREGEFTRADTHTPDLPSEAFPYFLAEAKSICFYELLQDPNEKEEQRSRKLQGAMNQTDWNKRGSTRIRSSYGRRV